MGRENSLANTLLLSDRSTAAIIQWAVLCVEASAIMAVFLPRFRVAIGVALLVLYVGIADSFGFSFLLNAFLVAAFYFPWSRIMDRVCDVAERHLKVTLTVVPGSRLAHILGFVLPRFDVLRVIKLSNE